MSTKQLGFHVNLSACTGCRACQIACKDKNDLPVGVNWRRVMEYSGGEWVNQGKLKVASNVFTYYVSISCMHCAEPLCVEVCPTGARFKTENGTVQINQDVCIGCRYCEWACPYGAPQYNAATQTMTKCTFCPDLVAKGERPACVDACPQRAIDFGPLDELQAKYGTFSDPAPLPGSELTNPSMVFTPHRDTEPSSKATGKVTNVEVRHERA